MKRARRTDGPAGRHRPAQHAADEPDEKKDDQPVTGRMAYRVAGRHGFAVMWSDNVPINHPGKCVSPILFRLAMAALLIATGWPAIASAQAILEISSPAPNAVMNPGQ